MELLNTSLGPSTIGFNPCASNTYNKEHNEKIYRDFLDFNNIYKQIELDPPV
jgi:hypothetical protein